MKALKEKNEALGMNGLMQQTAEIGNLGAVFNVRVSYSQSTGIQSGEDEIYQTTAAASVYKTTTEASVEHGAIFNQAVVDAPPLAVHTKGGTLPYRSSLKQTQEKRESRVLASSQVYKDAENMDDMLE